MALSQILLILSALLVIRLSIYPCFSALINPLRSIPGPLIARFSRLYYLFAVWKGDFHYKNLVLHRHYGPIVRVAPNMYSIDSPSAVKNIYGVTTRFAKSDWYDGWRHPDPKKNSLFPQRDVKLHADTRKLFQGMYSMSTLVSYEGYVNECADIFSQRLEEFAKDQQIVDMGHWLQCYAFDVIGDITYSERFGFLDSGEDKGGVFRALSTSHWYSSLAGIYPEWHLRCYWLQEHIKGSGAEARSSMMKLVGQLLARRQKQQSLKAEGKEEVAVVGENAPEDFISKIMQARKTDARVTDFHVFMMGIANIFAGSDTTAVSLSAILYYLLKSPTALRRLREEIAGAEEKGRCGKDNVSFKESLDMPYLQAVMKEAMRLHAATGLPMWREVPQGGAEIEGRFFPAGSVVGINTWVAHYSEEVFGQDAAEFKPERWIEAEKEGGDKIKRMEAYYFPFGLGSRTCLGKHISILEMSKLIPRLVRRFDFELENTDRAWKTVDYWFVRPVDFRVKVKLRV